MRKRNRKGTLVNGYLLTGILVGIIILLPIVGIKDMNELVKWLTNLNSVVMPMRYLWVFLAYMMLNKAYKKFTSEYKFVKNPKSALFFGAWCFAFLHLLVFWEWYQKSNMQLIQKHGGSSWSQTL